MIQSSESEHIYYHLYSISKRGAIYHTIKELPTAIQKIFYLLVEELI